MPVTSNRAASTWTPQLIGKAEEFFNSGAVEDLMIRQYLYYFTLKSKGRVKIGNWGHTQTLAVNQLDQGGVTWFDHLDTIAAPAQDGPQAASWYRAQCAKGLSYSATQEADNKNGNVDLGAFAVDSMMQDFLKDWNRTLVIGGGSASKQPDGMESALPAITHITNDATTAVTYMARQATNIYAGIDRSPYTSATAGGTGWENVSLDLDASTNTALAGPAWADQTDNVFKFTSGAASLCLKALDNAILMAADGGGTAPDIGLWTRQPFLDYCSMYPSHVQYTMTGGATNEYNLKADTIKHGSMVIGWSDEFQDSGTSQGTGYGAAANGEKMFLINSDTTCLLTEEGWNFASRPWLAAQNQMASSLYVVWRGFNMFTNPRKCATLFNYGVA